MGSRTWIKIYCNKWLEDTISEESISIRGVWVSLLALAGNGKYGDSGQIMALRNVGFTDQQLTLMLKISPKMWGIARKRLLETDRISIENGNIIAIVNWKKYQSEYERQKPQRIKSADKSATESAAIDYRVESIDYRVENIYIHILDLWNEQKIIFHKKLTTAMKRAIDSAKGDYSQEEIGQSINNYAEIVNGTEYYFNHKWTLVEFLNRQKGNNIERFLDIETAKQNFLKDKKGGGNGVNQRSPRALPKVYTRPEDL